MKIGWEEVDYKYDSVKQKWMIDGEEFNLIEGDEEEESVGFDEDPSEKILRQLPESELMVNSPFGMFEVKEAFNPLNHFNFWIGHTDFDIDHKFVSIVNKTIGIEGLKIMSRYRFLIAIGKMFTMTKVRAALELNLGILKFSPSVLQKKEELTSSGNDWMMYVYPDLKTFEYTSSSDKDFYSKIEHINQLNENQSGILLTSNS